MTDDLDLAQFAWEHLTDAIAVETPVSLRVPIATALLEQRPLLTARLLNWAEAVVDADRKLMTKPQPQPSTSVRYMPMTINGKPTGRVIISDDGPYTDFHEAQVEAMKELEAFERMTQDDGR